MTVSPDSYRHRLAVLAVAYEANVAALIWGPPGEGKSSLIADFADGRGIHHEVVVASLRDPTDINGIPIATDDGTVRFSPPQWLNASNAQDGSLVVFDEINLAPPATRGAVLRVVNERVSADTPLNPDTRIVAIANPPEIAEDGWELGAPMSNRFLHIRDWQLPVETFSAGLLAGAWTQPPQLTVDTEALIESRAEAAAAVSAFLRDDPARLRQLPTDPADRQYAWPSPRSWTHCTELLAVARAATIDGNPIDEEVVALLVEGTIGPALAPPFLAFLSALDLPDPADLLTNPTGWDVPERGDLAWAVLSRLLGHLAAEGDRAGIDEWKASGQVLAHAAANGQGDVAVAVAQDWWAQARKHGPAVLPKELAEGRFAAVLRLVKS